MGIPHRAKVAVSQGWRQEFSNRGADSSDRGAKIRLSGY